MDELNFLIKNISLPICEFTQIVLSPDFLVKALFPTHRNHSLLVLNFLGLIDLTYKNESIVTL